MTLGERLFTGSAAATLSLLFSWATRDTLVTAVVCALVAFVLASTVGVFILDRWGE